MNRSRTKRRDEGDPNYDRSERFHGNQNYRDRMFYSHKNLPPRIDSIEMNDNDCDRLPRNSYGSRSRNRFQFSKNSFVVEEIDYGHRDEFSKFQKNSRTRYRHHDRFDQRSTTEFEYQNNRTEKPQSSRGHPQQSKQFNCSNRISSLNDNYGESPSSISKSSNYSRPFSRRDQLFDDDQSSKSNQQHQLNDFGPESNSRIGCQNKSRQKMMMFNRNPIGHRKNFLRSKKSRSPYRFRRDFRRRLTPTKTNDEICSALTSLDTDESPFSVATKEMCYFCFEILDSYLNHKSFPCNPNFTNESFPLFVTWKIDPEQQLRGCIGTFNALPLHSALKNYALSSALKDDRFQPISREELIRLHVCVSLLLQFEVGANYKDWIIGVHGVRIEFFTENRNKRVATYLPEVAVEQGWNHAETIDSLLRKGGYRGHITEEVRLNIRLIRYRSEKISVSYDDYIRAKTSNRTRTK
ncbi:solute carrier family 41 member 1-like [Sarcoptes scabiei]|nr:solute carrier family 41 member 1-like [Sarcoptes scabiei]